MDGGISEVFLNDDSHLGTYVKLSQFTIVDGIYL